MRKLCSKPYSEISVSCGRRRLQLCYPGDSGLGSLMAETPALGRRLRSGSSCSRKIDPKRVLGQKNSIQNTKSKGKTMELGYGNAKEGRSMRFVADLWIKTYQNSENFQIDPKHEYGLFFWEFSNLWRNQENEGESVATKSC